MRYSIGITTAVVLFAGPVMAEHFSQPNRLEALQHCNDASIEKWSYHGTPFDKEQQRGFVYRDCMFRHGQQP
jgi:hypothetical protein